MGLDTWTMYKGFLVGTDSAVVCLLPVLHQTTKDITSNTCVHDKESQVWFIFSLHKTTKGITSNTSSRITSIIHNLIFHFQYRRTHSKMPKMSAFYLFIYHYSLYPVSLQYNFKRTGMKLTSL